MATTHVYLDINASGFAGALGAGYNMLDCAIRPVALTAAGSMTAGRNTTSSG